MEIIYLGIGLIVGILLGAGGIVIFKQKKENVDLGSFKTELENLTKEVKSYHTKADKDRGSINQIYTDIRTIEQSFVSKAEGFEKVLVSGGSQQQGAWGELVLEKILEHLGFTEGVEYDRKTFITEEGRKTPDTIVHLSDHRDVVIDSKVSLKDWYEYVNATDKIVKQQALKRHTVSVENHIKSLAKRNYQKIKDIKSLDTVIMFTPNDQCIFGLGKVSRDFMDLAFSKKITLVGPAMIYFVLKAVDANWKADKQSKNLKQVIEIADKVCSQAVEIYESAKNSKDSIEETIKSLDKVLSKIQDGRGSFLGRIKNMIKIGGFTPKKSIPFDAKEHIESDNVQTIAAKEVDKDE